MEIKWNRYEIFIRNLRLNATDAKKCRDGTEDLCADSDFFSQQICC